MVTDMIMSLPRKISDDYKNSIAALGCMPTWILISLFEYLHAGNLRIKVSISFSFPMLDCPNTKYTIMSNCVSIWSALSSEQETIAFIPTEKVSNHFCIR